MLNACTATHLYVHTDCLTNLNKNQLSYQAMTKVSRHVILQSNSIRQQENNEDAKYIKGTPVHVSQTGNY